MFALGDLDPVNRIAAQNPALGAALRRNRPADPLPPLSRAEEESVLSRIGSAATGGIGYAGEVLEKTFGGRAVRGLLGGRPRELLSVLPGSDLLGITDVADRVSGKRLLGYREDDDSWGATLAGIGTELALDPGMYLSFGGSALTGAGGVAKAAGVLPRTVMGRAGTTLAQALASAAPEARAAAEAAAGGAAKLAPLMGEALGGVVGLGLPFSKPSVVLGAGQGGVDFLRGLGSAAKAADAALRAVPLAGRAVYGSAADGVAHGLDFLGRHGRALFDQRVMGATTHAGQQAAEEASGVIAPLLARYRGQAAKYAEELEALGAGGRGGELRQYLEGVHPSPQSLPPELRALADRMRGDLLAFHQEAQGLGLNVPHWADPVNRGMNYFPRQQAALGRPTAGSGARQALALSDEGLTGARQPILEGFAGGTEGVNRLVLDPRAYEGTALERAKYIRDSYLHPVSEATHHADAVGDAVLRQQKQSLKLADWLDTLDPQYRASIGTQNPLYFFGHHPLADYESYFTRAARLMGSGEAVQNLLARSAVSAADAMPAGGLRLADALEAAGMTGAGAQGTLAGRLGKRLGRDVGTAELFDHAVTPEAMAEVRRYLRPFSAPQEVGPILRGYDTLTNLTKAMQTALWPSFHVRNLVSGAWQNLAQGGSLADAADAYRLVGGGVARSAAEVPDFARAGLSAEQATRELAREMYAHGVGGQLPHIAREVLGPSGEAVSLGNTLEDFLQRIPGRQPRSVGGALSELGSMAPGAWNPLNAAGVATNADVFSPVVAGRQLGDVVEGTNRGALYLGLRKQGFAPAEAAKQVLAAHFDYTPAAYTPFERAVMRRLVPFYSFSRNNIPLQLSQMIQSPGGMGATLARVSGDLRQQGGFLPEYLGQGLAVPLGEEDPSTGLRRYLTRLDLPPEQALDFVKGGPDWLAQSLMGAAGQLNPLVKGPLEYATGKQFFTGRDIGDLYSMTGNQLLDTAIANSPLSRAATTLRTLTDPAKLASPAAASAIPLNLLTGLRVSDIDMERQKDIAAREYAKAALQGRPEFGSYESVYMRPGMEHLLTPEEVMLYRLQRTVQQRGRQQARGGSR
jgi:hypothetical protein